MIFWLKFQKSREILINPSIGGKNCPRKMERKKKCRQMPCPANTKYWYQGSWRYKEYFSYKYFLIFIRKLIQYFFRHMVDPEDE